jgi:hypothetical protein
MNKCIHLQTPNSFNATTIDYPSNYQKIIEQRTWTLVENPSRKHCLPHVTKDMSQCIHVQNHSMSMSISIATISWYKKEHTSCIGSLKVMLCIQGVSFHSLSQIVVVWITFKSLLLIMSILPPSI